MNAIGIDIGTTSICGVIIDVETKKVIKSVTKNSDAFIKSPHKWEKIQSVEKIIALATEILDSLMDKNTVCIGVTGQMHGIVYVNKEGKNVSCLYTWQDERGNLPYKDTTYARYLESFSGYGNVTDFYNRENNLVPENAVSYCTIHDYFVMTLCNLKVALIHSTNGASFGCYDLKENKFNYDNNIEITTDFTLAGTYKNVPVSVAIGDNQASVYASLKDDDCVLVNVGTGSQVSVVSDDILVADGIETRPYFDNKYLLVGAALCGGRAYSMLKDFYKEILSFAGNYDDGFVYEIMNKMLSGGNDKLNVDTRFAGTRLNENVKGGIFNINTLNFTPASLTKGFVFGMAEELFNMYKLMNTNKKGLVGSGNGIRKNMFLVKEFEGIFQSEMLISKHLEEAAIGAAYFSLVASAKAENTKEIQAGIEYV